MGHKRVAILRDARNSALLRMTAAVPALRCTVKRRCTVVNRNSQRTRLLPYGPFHADRTNVRLRPFPVAFGA
jgi:hypothetical protein